MRNAAIIIKVGQDMKVPPRGWVIAVATAMQESGLRNLRAPRRAATTTTRSGLFQQRPSQGWGTPAAADGPGLRGPQVLREAAEGRGLADRCR